MMMASRKVVGCLVKFKPIAVLNITYSEEIFGKTYGDMFLRGTLSDKDIELNCAGCYQWDIV